MNDNNGPPKIDVTEPPPTLVPLEAVVQINIVHNFATGEQQVQATTQRFDLILAALETAKTTILASKLKSGEESRIVKPQIGVRLK